MIRQTIVISQVLAGFCSWGLMYCKIVDVGRAAATFGQTGPSIVAPAVTPDCGAAPSLRLCPACPGQAASRDRVEPMVLGCPFGIRLLDESEAIEGNRTAMCSNQPQERDNRGD